MDTVSKRLKHLNTELHWINEHAYSVKHHVEFKEDKLYKSEMKNLLEAIEVAQKDVNMLRTEATLKLLESRLENCLRAGTPETLRIFAIECSNFAIKYTGLSDEILDRALAAIKNQTLLTDFVPPIHKIVYDFDQMAFELRDIEDNKKKEKRSFTDYSTAFSKSRAAESVLAQLEEVEPLAKATRTVYEALAATGETDSIYNMAKKILQQETGAKNA